MESSRKDRYTWKEDDLEVIKPGKDSDTGKAETTEERYSNAVGMLKALRTK